MAPSIAKYLLNTPEYLEAKSITEFFFLAVPPDLPRDSHWFYIFQIAELDILTQIRTVFYPIVKEESRREQLAAEWRDDFRGERLRVLGITNEFDALLTADAIRVKVSCCRLAWNQQPYFIV
jgi:hypothetical protein